MASSSTVKSCPPFFAFALSLPSSRLSSEAIYMESNANQFPKPRLQSEVGCTSPASVHSGRLKQASTHGSFDQMSPVPNDQLSAGAHGSVDGRSFLSSHAMSSAESATDSFVWRSDLVCYHAPGSLPRRLTTLSGRISARSK